MGDDERRGGSRLDLRLRVRFLSEEHIPEAEATDISPGGARIESRVPIEQDSIITMELDAGDGETVQATGTVAWCRPRKSLSLRKLYDVGIRFETEWLSQKRGKLGTALGRIFAFGDFEPARAYDRVDVTLRAESVGSTELKLTVVDISEGGMQLRSEGELGKQIRTGATLIMEIPHTDETISLDGEIVWVAEVDGDQSAIYSSFGVHFPDAGVKELGALRALKTGDYVPASISLFLPG